MGVYLHSAKKHEIEYSTASAFNYMSDVINPILEVLTEHDLGYEGDYLGGARQLWGNRKKLLRNVDKIVNKDSDWKYQEELDEVIEDLKKAYPEVDIAKIHSSLKAIILESDPRNIDAYFTWF